MVMGHRSREGPDIVIERIDTPKETECCLKPRNLDLRKLVFAFNMSLANMETRENQCPG
jgi:hypothetical protein